MNYRENILSIEDLRKRRFAKKILSAGQKIYLTVLEETFQNRKFFNRKDPLDILMITDSMFNAGRSKNIRRYIEVFFNFLTKFNQEKHPRFYFYKEKDVEELTETRLREIISLMREKNEKEIEKMTHFFKEKKRRFIHSLNEE